MIDPYNNYHIEDVEIICTRSGGISAVEGLMLYNAVMSAGKDCNAIEFSPNAGYSTICMALALRRMGSTKKIATFEIDRRIEQKLTENIAKLGLQDYVDIIWGDALVEVPRYIKAHGIEDRVDVLFIDSCHSKSFAEAYIRDIFPLCNCALVMVHDIGALGLNNHDDFNETLFPNDNNCGEYLALKSYLRCKYVLTHAVYGGQHEASCNLPVNKMAYDKLSDSVGYTVPIDIPPKSLIFFI